MLVWEQQSSMQVEAFGLEPSSDLDKWCNCLQLPATDRDGKGSGLGNLMLAGWSTLTWQDKTSRCWPGDEDRTPDI